MAKKRDQIKMSADEVARFLDGQRVLNVSTNGRDGWPHMTSLWYVMRGTEPWVWTYAKSQKVLNLERDERATLLVEAGHEYHELMGVMLKARAELHREIEAVAAVGEELFNRYQRQHSGSIDDAAREALKSQAAKRVAIQFHVVETVTWDHSKLGGAY
jgi:nitroimidazol reductase NimA-like FMN-containing flavoprotein (pyridoxamine 5'-phosphate oxidase superfamily)